MQFDKIINNILKEELSREDRIKALKPLNSTMMLFTLQIISPMTINLEWI
jgi:hypothetical protein